MSFEKITSKMMIFVRNSKSSHYGDWCTCNSYVRMKFSKDCLDFLFDFSKYVLTLSLQSFRKYKGNISSNFWEICHFAFIPLTASYHLIDFHSNRAQNDENSVLSKNPKSLQAWVNWLDHCQGSLSHRPLLQWQKFGFTFLFFDENILNSF